MSTNLMVEESEEGSVDQQLLGHYQRKESNHCSSSVPSLGLGVERSELPEQHQSNPSTQNEIKVHDKAETIHHQMKDNRMHND